jgi:serine/threonine-protein kinase
LTARKHDYLVGDTLRGEGGDYVVLKILGHGGMGAVYLVRDKNIGKRFVLKVMHRRLAHRRDIMVRVEHEARALGNLSPHEGIIEIFALSWTRDRERIPYYLMEALTGETVAEAITRQGKLDRAAALGTAVKVLHALDHAHCRGVIHRDVKPDNVFLHGEKGVKLLDFGILKLAAAAEDHGLFIGTPRHAAPEQLRGEEVGPAADIYAVGVMLFQMLTGRHPFEGHGTRLEDVMATLHVQAPSLALMGDFPRDLVALVDRALAKNPKERPGDAFTFASDLHEIHARVVAEAAKDPHTQTTVESRIEPTREPSQITMAHLAEPTNEDSNLPSMVAALYAAQVAKERADASVVTGFESTADEKLPPNHTLPSRAPVVIAYANEAPLERDVPTAAPSKPIVRDAVPGSLRYVAATNGAPQRSTARMAPMPPAPYMKPFFPSAAEPRKNSTVPMAGRPTRPSETPAPLEIGMPSAGTPGRSVVTRMSLPVTLVLAASSLTLGAALVLRCSPPTVQTASVEVPPPPAPSTRPSVTPATVPVAPPEVTVADAAPPPSEPAQSAKAAPVLATPPKPRRVLAPAPTPYRPRYDGLETVF